jgi:hypothetical protein
MIIILSVKSGSRPSGSQERLRAETVGISKNFEKGFYRVNDCLLSRRLTVQATSDPDASPLFAGKQVVTREGTYLPPRN